MVSNGNMQAFMPPFASLSVPERWDVIAYAYTLSMTPDELMQGESLFQANCAVCHGVRGEGDGPEAGSLTVSPVDFTDQEFMGARSAVDLFDSITNGLGEMHSYVDLPEDDRWALTSYLRTLSFDQPSSTVVEPDPTETEAPIGDEPAETPTEIDPSNDDGLETGFVTIAVANISGGDLPTGMEAVLYVYDHMTEVFSKTVTIPEDGLVLVGDIPMVPDQFLFATMDQNGLSYGSPLVVVEPGVNDYGLEIRYADTTTDPAILQAERIHVFFDFIDPEVMQVFVLYIFMNSSNQVLLGPDEMTPAISFTLPEGATNLKRDVGMSFEDVDTANGFGLMTVYPSDEPYQVLYSFDLPYEKKKAEFDLPVDLETNAAIVMSPENGVKVKSDQLSDAGMRDIEGVSYNMFTGGYFPAGSQLDLAVSGLPKAPSDPTAPAMGGGDNTGLVIGLAAFGVVLVGAGVYLWFRNRDEDDDWLEDDLATENGLADVENPDDLMDAIITLDDLYASGEIPEAAYLERRSELKAQLKGLLGE
jgi:mono/diheme cytochrome c family protein